MGVPVLHGAGVIAGHTVAIPYGLIILVIAYGKMMMAIPKMV